MYNSIQNSIEKYKKIIEEGDKLEKELSNLNTNRGNTIAGTAGFVAESLNAHRNNFDRINSGKKSFEFVIDNNGAADTAVLYNNGVIGRWTQDKCGYTPYQIKKMIESGKYDGQKLRINKDNEIFSPENKNKLEKLEDIAKERNIKIVKSLTSKSEAESLTKAMKVEGKLNRNNKAPVVIKVFSENEKAKQLTNAAIQDVKNTINNANTFIDDSIEEFISKEFSSINRSGIDEALSSAIFAATLSVTKNAISLCKGEEEFDKAFKQVAIDTASSAALGYVAGVTQKVLNLDNISPAYLLVNTTLQYSKQMIAYINGDINETQLAENILESSAYLVAAYAGKCIGEIIGDAILPGIGGFIGQYVGEMITTAVCVEVMSTIKFSKEFDKQNSKIISLYRSAEAEIRASQERLKYIIQRENIELLNTINRGFDEIALGIQNDSHDQIFRGLFIIGEKFGLSEDDFTDGIVTRDNLFDNENVVMFN